MQLLNKFPTFYKTQMFITVFTTARQMPLSWPRTMLSTHSKPFELNIILPFMPVFSNGLYPSSFPTISLHPHACHIPRSPHPPTFDHPKNICWAAQIVQCNDICTVCYTMLYHHICTVGTVCYIMLYDHICTVSTVCYIHFLFLTMWETDTEVFCLVTPYSLLSW